MIFSSDELFAHAQTSKDIENLKQVNQETVTNTGRKIYDALKSAQQALDVTIKMFGEQHNETAISYTNWERLPCQKNMRSSENLQKALAIYQKNPAGYEEKLQKFGKLRNCFDF